VHQCTEDYKLTDGSRTSFCDSFLCHHKLSALSTLFGVIEYAFPVGCSIVIIDCACDLPCSVFHFTTVDRSVFLEVFVPFKCASRGIRDRSLSFDLEGRGSCAIHGYSRSDDSVRDNSIRVFSGSRVCTCNRGIGRLGINSL